MLTRPFLTSPEQAARRLVHLAATTGAVAGRYYVGTQPATPSPLVDDELLAAAVYDDARRRLTSRRHPVPDRVARRRAACMAASAFGYDRPMADADRWRGHQLLLAAPHDELWGVARWVRAGLESGSTMFYAATEERSSIEDLLTGLVARGVDAGAAAERGQLAVLEPAMFFPPGEYERRAQEAVDRRGAEVRGFSSRDAAAAVLSDEQFNDFERMCEQLWATRGASVVCRYDPGAGIEEEKLADPYAAHTSGWVEEMVHVDAPQPGRLRVVGEVDVGNDQVLAGAMRTVCSGFQNTVVVDCARLRFTSVSAWRAAAAEARAFRDRGGRVRLESVEHMVEWMLSVTGFADAFEVERGR